MDANDGAAVVVLDPDDRRPALAAIGGYVVSQKTGFEELSDFATDPGIILAALGCFVFFISFCLSFAFFMLLLVSIIDIIAE